MGTDLADLWVFKQAETLADGVWKVALRWDQFAKNTVGEQLVRAADSVGANISEAHDRFSYGEKLQFFYYARGSLYETRYWLRRAWTRELLKSEAIDDLRELLRTLAIGLNNFTASLKEQRGAVKRSTAIKETSAAYQVAESIGESIGESIDENTYSNQYDPISQSLDLSISQLLQRELFTQEEILWLTNLTDENGF